MIPGVIDPNRLQQILTEVTQQQVDRYNAALHETLDYGWLIWEMAPPRRRLKGYMASTLMNDIPLVLTDGYLDLWHNGLLPPLEALGLFQQATIQSQLTGQPIMDTQSLFWPLLMCLPEWVFVKFQHDFANLVKDLLRQTHGMPALQGPGQVPGLPPGQANPAMEQPGSAVPAMPGLPQAGNPAA